MSNELWSGNQGILCVYVSKAKDLPNLNKLDKQNVMLRLRIAHMTRESDILLRAGQNPVFNYLEKYEITPEVKPTMQVEAYCDRKKKPPILIGRCEVDLLNGIRADPKEGYCSWYELKRERNEFAGTIFIELTFTPSLPRSLRDKRGPRDEDLDASMVRRPVPPLPGESEDFNSELGQSINGPYIHASVMRDPTPRIRVERGISEDISSSMPALRNYSTTNFESSVHTNRTSISQDTNATATSDTKFHFANLKKLKEKINVFKNANNSINNYQQSETPVDIAALQKAIGVSSLDGDESDEDGEWVDRPGDRRNSFVNKLECQPPLPPLPKSADKGNNFNSDFTRIPQLPKVHRANEQRFATPIQGMSSPLLPPLPGEKKTKSRSASPKRRPPPTA